MNWNQDRLLKFTSISFYSRMRRSESVKSLEIFRLTFMISSFASSKQKLKSTATLKVLIRIKSTKKYKVFIFRALKTLEYYNVTLTFKPKVMVFSSLGIP